MSVKEAISLFRFYKQSNHRKRTTDSYRFLLQHFDSVFSDRNLDSIKPDEIYHFLEQMTKTFPLYSNTKSGKVIKVFDENRI